MVISQSERTYIHVPLVKINESPTTVFKLRDINNTLTTTSDSYEENLNGKERFPER